MICRKQFKKIEVIHNDPEIKQVDEVFVEINQSHISFQNIFNQISLKEICEEGVNSISIQGSVSFENQQKSKSLLQHWYGKHWYTPNVANKSPTELFYIKIGRLVRCPTENMGCHEHF